MKNLFVGCAGVALILGIVAFGYILFRWIGYFTFLPTTLFAACAVMGINLSIKEAESKYRR